MAKEVQYVKSYMSAMDNTTKSAELDKINARRGDFDASNLVEGTILCIQSKSDPVQFFEAEINQRPYYGFVCKSQLGSVCSAKRVFFGTFDKRAFEVELKDGVVTRTGNVVTTNGDARDAYVNGGSLIKDCWETLVSRGKDIKVEKVTRVLCADFEDGKPSTTKTRWVNVPTLTLVNPIKDKK